MTRIGQRYALGRSLGRGAMGEVYEAEDEQLQQRIAIKVLRAEARSDPRAVARLRREITTGQRVTHPNVCRVFDVEPGVGFITMELLEGETLAARLGRGPLTTADALPLVEQLCAGLAAAHAAGVVHRDFKPHNVMLCGARAVITDFGLAIALEGGDPTQSIELMGTPAYMAPEQLTGGKVTVAVDVYALGVTMFEMVTGALPFVAATPLATALARLERDAPSPREQVRELDPRWDAIIGRCLARDPAVRPPVAAIVAALRGSMPRSRRRWLAGGLLALAAAAVVAAFALAGDRPRPTQVETRATGLVARLVRLQGAGEEMIDDAFRDRGGNLYLAGHFSPGARLGGAALIHPGGAALAGFVARLGGDGRLRWQRPYTSGSQAAVVMVVTDDDGRVFVAGWAKRGVLDVGDGARPVRGDGEGFLIALAAADGRVQWGRRMESVAGGSIKAGGLGPDGNLYVTGEYAGTLALGDGREHRSEGPSPFVASYDRAGAVRWVVAGTGGTTTRMGVLDFVDGAVVVGGEVAGEVDLAAARWSQVLRAAPFAAAIDLATGAVRWARPFVTEEGSTLAIAATGASSLVLGGWFRDRIELAPARAPSLPRSVLSSWIAELEPATGVVRWATLISDEPPHGQAEAIARLPDGRLIVVGTFFGQLRTAGRTFIASGPSDLYVVIVDPAGGVVAATAIEGPATEHVEHARVLPDGTLALWGNHQGLRLGGVALATEGLADGFYAELRLAELFPDGLDR